MNCDEARELILTDYADGRMIGVKQIEMDMHMRECGSCSEFAGVVRTTGIDPFHNALRPTPPEEMWAEIQRHLNQEMPSAARPVTGWIWRVKKTLVVQRIPIAVTATLVIVMVSALFIASPRYNVQQADEDRIAQIDYMANLLDGAIRTEVDEDVGYGTWIEEYFL